MKKINRNDKCPCRSGLKFKKCCQPEMDKRKQDDVVLSRKERIDRIIRIIRKVKERLERSPANERRSL